jgi:hypothetical protein
MFDLVCEEELMKANKYVHANSRFQRLSPRIFLVDLTTTISESYRQMTIPTGFLWKKIPILFLSVFPVHFTGVIIFT